MVVEAMASGLPVIATSCIGPSELVTSGVEGMLVPVGSIARMADAIVRMAGDSDLRERMSRAARRRAVDEFSIPRTSEQLARVYHGAGLTEGQPEHVPTTARYSGTGALNHHM